MKNVGRGQWLKFTAEVQGLMAKYQDQQQLLEGPRQQQQFGCPPPPPKIPFQTPFLLYFPFSILIVTKHKTIYII
jgi:hypothetical protein